MNKEETRKKTTEITEVVKFTIKCKMKHKITPFSTSMNKQTY